VSAGIPFLPVDQQETQKRGMKKTESEGDPEQKAGQKEEENCWGRMCHIIDAKR